MATTCETEGCKGKPKQGETLCVKCRKLAQEQESASKPAEPTLQDLMSSIDRMEDRLTTRMDKIESNISETIKSIVQTEISTFKQNMEAEINALKAQVRELEKRPQGLPGEGDGCLSIVIGNLPEGNDAEEEQEEDLVLKVNTLLHEGVDLPEIDVDSVERKKSHKDNVPGVVIAQCKSQGDKKLIMSNKSKLKDSDDYSNVIIHPHKSPVQLQMESSLRTIVNTVGADKLQMKGNRVVRKHDNQQGSQTQGRGRGRGGGRGSNRGSRGGGRGRGGRGGPPR